MPRCEIVQALLRRWCALGLAAATLIAAPGCLIIPVPNSRVEGSGVKSRVVDADNGRGVQGARISEIDRGISVTADKDGRFALPPHIQWHAAYLWGVISYPIWPFTGDLIVPGCRIRIEAAGYSSAEYAIAGLGNGSTKPSAEEPESFLVVTALDDSQGLVNRVDFPIGA